MPPKTKKCPYCSQTLRATSTICLFCGHNLDVSVTPPIVELIAEQEVSMPKSTPIQLPPQSIVNIQKWEYAELEVTIGGPLSGTWCEGLIYQVDKKHEKTQGNFGELLAGLGEKGWELIAASARIESGFGNKHKINYILKRPKN